MHYSDFLYLVPIIYILLLMCVLFVTHDYRLDKVEAILENRICNECNQIIGD